MSTADVDRINYVCIIHTQCGKYQYQGLSNYYGLCCLNNALGIQKEGPLVSAEYMDMDADSLWIDMGDNPSFGFNIQLEPMRDREGFYSIEVLQSVLQDFGFNMLPLNFSSFVNQELREIGVTVCKQLMCEYGMATLIVKPVNSQHWVTIKVVNEQIQYLDSKQKTPELLTVEQLGRYILCNLSTEVSLRSGLFYIPYRRQLSYQRKAR